MMTRSQLSPSNQRELGRLLVSLRASVDRLDLFLAVCDDPDLRDAVISQYESAMKKEEVATYRTRLDSKDPSLKATLATLVKYNPSLVSGSKAVVTVLGGAQLFGVRLAKDDPSEQDKFFFSLQWTREALREFRFPVVIWLSDTVATGVAQKAQDFWSWRSGVFEFERQPAEVEPDRGNVGVEVQAAQGRAQEQQTNDAEKAAAIRAIADLDQEIADLFQQNPTSPLLITLYSDLGDAYRKQSNAEPALYAYNQALKLIAKETNTPKQAEIFLKIGQTLRKGRRYEQAEGFFRQALTIFQDIDDRYRLTETYYYLGDIALDQRKFEEARSHYQQALDLKIEFGDRYSQSSTYGQLGLLAEAQNDYGQAQQHLQQALEIFAEFNDQHSVEITLKILGRIYQATQDESILTNIAQCLNATVEDVQQRFANLNRNE